MRSYTNKKRLFVFFGLCLALHAGGAKAQYMPTDGTGGQYPGLQMPPIAPQQSPLVSGNNMSMPPMPMGGMSMNPSVGGGGMMMPPQMAQQMQMPMPEMPDTSPPSVMEQALSLHQAGRYADAVHVYESIIFSSAPDPRLYASIADAHFRLGNYERALKYVVEALKLDPNYSSAHLLLGTVLGEMGDYVRAIRSYQRVLRLDQNNPYAYYNLGLLYYKKSEIGIAIEYLEKARELNPNDPKIWNNLGVAYYDQSLFTQAMVAYSEALRLNPNYEAAARNMLLLRKSMPPPPVVSLNPPPRAKKSVISGKRRGNSAQKKAAKPAEYKKDETTQNNSPNNQSAPPISQIPQNVNMPPSQFQQPPVGGQQQIPAPQPGGMPPSGQLR